MGDRPTQGGIANFYKQGLEVGDYTINDILMILAGYELSSQSPCPNCGEQL